MSLKEERTSLWCRVCTPSLAQVPPAAGHTLVAKETRSQHCLRWQHAFEHGQHDMTMLPSKQHAVETLAILASLLVVSHVIKASPKVEHAAGKSAMRRIGPPLHGELGCQNTPSLKLQQSWKPFGQACSLLQNVCFFTCVLGQVNQIWRASLCSPWPRHYNDFPWQLTGSPAHV